MNRTIGDQYELECPACGCRISDLWDLGDELRDGKEIDCGHCGVAVVLYILDITVCIAAEVKP